MREVVFVVGGVVGVFFVDGAADFAVDGPGDVVGLPVDGVGVGVGDGVCGLNGRSVIVYIDLLARLPSFEMPIVSMAMHLQSVTPCQ